MGKKKYKNYYKYKKKNTKTISTLYCLHRNRGPNFKMTEQLYHQGYHNTQPWSEPLTNNVCVGGKKISFKEVGW